MEPFVYPCRNIQISPYSLRKSGSMETEPRVKMGPSRGSEHPTFLYPVEYSNRTEMIKQGLYNRPDLFLGLLGTEERGFDLGDAILSVLLFQKLFRKMPLKQNIERFGTSSFGRLRGERGSIASSRRSSRPWPSELGRRGWRREPLSTSPPCSRSRCRPKFH